MMAGADGRRVGRRSGILWLCVTLALVATTCTNQSPGGREASEDASEETPHTAVADRPNVFLIVTDDQRAEGTLAMMPTVRRLFEKRGTRFDNAVATTPLCCPSRAGIFSGRYSHNHGVTNNSNGWALDTTSTLQHYLQKAGYRTAVVGKYLQGVPVESTPPYFDDFAISEGHRYHDRRVNINGSMQLVKGYTTDFVGDFASRLIEEYEEQDDQPWFLYVAPNAVHAPHTPEKKYARARVPPLRPNKAIREDDLSDKPPYVRVSSSPTGIGPRVWRLQLRTLKSVDDMIDGVFDKIVEHEERDTIAIFMSDNGFMLGEHGLLSKRVPYRHSVQIPMLMRWPGRVEQGLRDDRIVANIDVAPTILEAAGIRPSEEFPIDGRSLLSDTRRRMILLEEYENDKRGIPDWASLLTASYQYTEYYTRGGEELRYREYYDLRADPFELDSLLVGKRSNSNLDVDSLSRALNEIKSCTGDQCP